MALPPKSYFEIDLANNAPSTWNDTIDNTFSRVYTFLAPTPGNQIQIFLQRVTPSTPLDLFLTLAADENGNGKYDPGIDTTFQFANIQTNASSLTAFFETSQTATRTADRFLAIVETNLTSIPNSVSYNISFTLEEERDAFGNPLGDVFISRNQGARTVVNVGGFETAVIEYVARDPGDLAGEFSASMPGSFDIEVYDDSNSNSILDFQDEKLLSANFSAQLSSSLLDAGGRGFLKITNNTSAASNVSIGVGYKGSRGLSPNLSAREGALPFVLDREYPLSQQNPIGNPIRDFDGNPHGANGGYPPGAEASYKYHGKADVNGDGNPEQVFTNRVTSRWATVSLDPITGAADYSKFGQGGSTRVVGIYVDPLVAEGEANGGFLRSGEVAPKRFGPFDSQQRFQNDLRIDNLQLKASADYDGDGLMETYWKVLDGTAYLHAYMHADGNIKYANYQSLQQMTDFLSPLGYGDVIPLITA